jgi:hypothetical protein
MTIKFVCQQCGHKLKADDELAGKRVRCTRCSQVAIVPAPNVASQGKAVDSPESIARSNNNAAPSGDLGEGSDSPAQFATDTGRVKHEDRSIWTRPIGVSSAPQTSPEERTTTWNAITRGRDPKVLVTVDRTLAPGLRWGLLAQCWFTDLGIFVLGVIDLNTSNVENPGPAYDKALSKVRLAPLSNGFLNAPKEVLYIAPEEIQGIEFKATPYGSMQVHAMYGALNVPIAVASTESLSGKFHRDFRGLFG